MPLYTQPKITVEASSSVERTGSYGGNSIPVDDSATTKLVDVNLNRAGLTIINVGGNTALIDLVPDIQAPECMVSLPPDGYYELPHPFYTKEVYAKSAEGSTLLVFRDFNPA